MNPNTIKIVKGLSLVLTIVGTIGSSIAGTYENKMIIQKMVDSAVKSVKE